MSSSFAKALVGCLLVPVYHIPRLVFLSLQLSYAYVFNRQENLTADPKVHLQRARKLLKGQNSQLLYCALEVRFALERMTKLELLMAEKVSNKDFKKYDPVKNVKALRRLDKNSQFEHAIYLVNPNTGEWIEWGRYKPLDEKRVSDIKGMLGNLLHPKVGLNLGISNDPWYIETRAFLAESIDYLSKVLEKNTPFFAFEGVEQIEMVRIGGDE